MGSRLFEPIRVNGIGSWDRSKDGEWKLAKMLIQTYEPLVDEDLGEVLRKLRAAPVVWPENADDLLRAEREPSL
jgi:predicted Rdx family selenoprotein